MKDFIKNFFLKYGIYLTRTTNEIQLMGLLNKLRPISTEHELIRFGDNSDGGYLLPNDLDGLKTCFSPGVGHETSFENSCVDIGMHIYLADGSVENPNPLNTNFSFEKKFIGAYSNQNFITIDEWVNNSIDDKKEDLLLQMDIEGYEYEVLYNISLKLLNQFRIILIEFHDLELLFSQPHFEKISNAFYKILITHECVHIHPNNCRHIQKKGNIEIPPVMEFTFLRKDRIKNKLYTKCFPHFLDINCAKKDEIQLPKCWYNDQ